MITGIESKRELVLQAERKIGSSTIPDLDNANVGSTNKRI